jgi:hypothetical protein
MRELHKRNLLVEIKSVNWISTNIVLWESSRLRFKIATQDKEYIRLRVFRDLVSSENSFQRRSSVFYELH